MVTFNNAGAGVPPIINPIPPDTSYIYQLDGAVWTDENDVDFDVYRVVFDPFNFSDGDPLSALVQNYTPPNPASITPNEYFPFTGAAPEWTGSYTITSPEGYLRTIAGGDSRSAFNNLGAYLTPGQLYYLHYQIRSFTPGAGQTLVGIAPAANGFGGSIAFNTISSSTQAGSIAFTYNSPYSMYIRSTSGSTVDVEYMYINQSPVVGTPPNLDIVKALNLVGAGGDVKRASDQLPYPVGTILDANHCSHIIDANGEIIFKQSGVTPIAGGSCWIDFVYNGVV